MREIDGLRIVGKVIVMKSLWCDVREVFMLMMRGRILKGFNTHYLILHV